MNGLGFIFCNYHRFRWRRESQLRRSHLPRSLRRCGTRTSSLAPDRKCSLRRSSCFSRESCNKQTIIKQCWVGMLETSHESRETEIVLRPGQSTTRSDRFPFDKRKQDNKTRKHRIRVSRRHCLPRGMQPAHNIVEFQFEFHETSIGR